MNTFIQKLVLGILFITSSVAATAQYQSMGSCGSNGRPNYLVNPSEDISENCKKNIKTTLPEWRSVPTYNPKLIDKDLPENISITCSADVWISFVEEGSSYLNALGYYTYPTNAPLTVAPTPDKIKIVFPYASKEGNGGGLKTGDKVFLGNFPANTSIAFVLLADGWDNTNKKVTAGRCQLYTDNRFNPESNQELKKHSVIIYDEDSKRYVVGMEDERRDDAKCDHDFNDLLFIVTTSSQDCVEHKEKIPKCDHDGDDSNSGHEGGLESKSLGDAVAKRIFNNAVNSTQGAINYAKMPLVATDIRNAVTGVGPNAALGLADIMPSKMIDPGYTAYVTTAADITSFTNATEVRSVDFTINNNCRAVAFATKTMGQLYDHTKPVCDRLKGASLLGMENISINNLNFVRYTLLQPTGNTEYAMSFSVGTKTGRSNFSFQSNWLTQNYTPDETMYNYQVWGATPYYCIDMALEILDKLNAIMPVQVLNSGTALPKTYIVSGKRDGTNLTISINNTTTAATGYFQIEERLAENTTAIIKRNVPVTVGANAISTIALPVSDSYESTISLYLNNQLQDVVFMADGTWNVDYNKNTTVLKSFTIQNDPNIANTPKEDYPLFRNVQVAATTSDYTTVYKLLKGGGAAQDLTAYKAIKFTAAATGANMRITLVKAGVSNWADQYSFYQPLSADSKEYSIALADFATSTGKGNISPSDITTVIFALEVPTTTLTAITAKIEQVAFSKSLLAPADVVSIKEVQLYPNPSKGRFTASFKSEKATVVTLKLVDINTGVLQLSKSINAVVGDNKVLVEMNQTINTNGYILQLEAEGAKYQPKKLIIQN
ncbi:MAG: DUF4114 domain-containing protein [Sediminibacterium sp.]